MPDPMTAISPRRATETTAEYMNRLNREHGAAALREDLRGRVGTNLRVYQRRVDAGTATDFDRGKRAAFMVVLTMLDDRPHEPTFSCGRSVEPGE